MEAYLDIETTGLSPYHHRVTVVGLSFGDDTHVIQLVGDSITACNLFKALEPATIVYTYNGTNFDLPFLRHRFGLNLVKSIRHRDLMLDCWEKNLYGGLKAVEKRLGISRTLKGIDGLEAAKLWNRYKESHDHNALHLLLDYNREDVLNLKTLRARLLGLLSPF